MDDVRQTISRDKLAIELIINPVNEENTFGIQNFIQSTFKLQIYMVITNHIYFIFLTAK